jgi:REP element-mobilizing transposase RayT
MHKVAAYCNWPIVGAACSDRRITRSGARYAFAKFRDDADNTTTPGTNRNHCCMPPDNRPYDDVAQPSPAASSRTVPVRKSGTENAPAEKSPGETPTELTAGAVGLPETSNPLVGGFHFRGVLPHLKKEGGTYFVTFRQAGTLPKEVLLRFKQERETILHQAMAAKRPLTWHEEEELFRWYSNRVDKYLDAGHGVCYLRNPDLAGLVSDALRFFDGQRYELRAWVVMPNHAHVVVWPIPGHTMSDILHSWKSFTSHEINKRLPTKVVPLWQGESYEHLIRDDEDLHRCCLYTLMNPVNAHLCTRLEDWQWSSAHVVQPRHVTEPYPATSCRTVPVRGCETSGQPRDESGGGTPPELAGEDACATHTHPRASLYTSIQAEANQPPEAKSEQ